MRALVFVATLLLLAGLGLAQPGTQPLISDRPDQTESASVVPHKHLQVETGAVFESNLWRHAATEPERRVLSLATTLFRFGLGDWAELRLASAYRSEATHYPDYRLREHGLEALSVGSKVGFWSEKAPLPQVAFIFSFDLPVGAEAFRPDFPEPTAIFAFTNTLSERWTLGYNFGATWPSRAGRVLHYTASLGYALSENTATFAELYGDDGVLQPATLLFDGGVTYLLKRTLQLDFSAGFALAQDLPGWFLSAGLSARFPD